MDANDKRVTLPFYAPLNWHGMTAGVWFSLLWRNRFDISLSHVPMTVSVSMMTVLNSCLRVVSEAIYRKKAERVRIYPAPIFVIGHWRTGTTLLHELLVKDKRFAFPDTYQCMAPHHFPLTNGILSVVADWLMPGSRPMDNMPVGMARPQEDEFALMNLGVGSPYLDWAFPNRGKTHDEFLTLKPLDEATREQWKSEFDWFLRRVAMCNPKRLVLKSPTHTARVSALLELFPDARFLHVVRNPLDTIPSTIRTWTRMTDALSMQVRRAPISEDRILDVFEQMNDQFEVDRQLLGDRQIHEVRFEDLVADPVNELREVYRQLELGDFEPARRGVEEYLRSQDGYQRNSHVVSDELRKKISSRCEAYIEKYGYAEWVCPAKVASLVAEET